MENFNEATPGGKLDAFFKELEKNGLKLSESPQYKKSKPMDLDRMDRPWTIQNDWLHFYMTHLAVHHRILSINQWKYNFKQKSEFLVDLFLFGFILIVLSET